MSAEQVLLGHRTVGGSPRRGWVETGAVRLSGLCVRRATAGRRGGTTATPDRWDWRGYLCATLVLFEAQWRSRSWVLYRGRSLRQVPTGSGSTVAPVDTPRNEGSGGRGLGRRGDTGQHPWTSPESYRTYQVDGDDTPDRASPTLTPSALRRRPSKHTAPPRIQVRHTQQHDTPQGTGVGGSPLGPPTPRGLETDATGTACQSLQYEPRGRERHPGLQRPLSRRYRTPYHPDAAGAHGSSPAGTCPDPDDQRARKILLGDVAWKTGLRHGPAGTTYVLGLRRPMGPGLGRSCGGAGGAWTSCAGSPGRSASAAGEAWRRSDAWGGLSSHFYLDGGRGLRSHHQRGGGGGG